MRTELEELKLEYIAAGDRLDQEQSGMMAVRKQTKILFKQVCCIHKMLIVLCIS